MAAVTVVVAVAVFVAALVAVTEAVLLTLGPWVGLTTIVRFAVAPAAIVPMGHCTVAPFALQSGLLKLTSVVPAGMGSVTATPVAAVDAALLWIEIV